MDHIALSVKCRIKQEKKINKIRKKHGDDKWQWRKVGESFPHFWTIRLMIIKKRYRKEKMKEKRRENERKEKMENEKEMRRRVNEKDVQWI